MSYVAFNVMTVLFVGCFWLYFDVVTNVETLDSLDLIEEKSGPKVATKCNILISWIFAIGQIIAPLPNKGIKSREKKSSLYILT